MTAFTIMSIDAWRDAEGGWYWNNSFKVGAIDRTIVENYTARKLLKYLREEGFLSDKSKGIVAIEDAGNYITIVDRRNGCPCIAIECNW